MELLSSYELASLLGLTVRQTVNILRKGHQGKTWRGARLDVTLDKGRGGRCGLSYWVNRASIPPEFIKAAPENAESVNNKTPLPADKNSLAVTEPCLSGELSRTSLNPLARKDRHHNEHIVKFKLDLVQQVRSETAPYTTERATLIKELAATVCYTYGKKRGQYVAETTIRQWVKEYETDGMTSALRKARNDSGSKRVMVSREWDKTVKKLGLRDEECQRLAADLKRHVASLWRSGTPSAPTVQLNALSFAVNQLTQNGCTLPAEELQAVCKLPENFIQALNHYKLPAIYRQDAARYAAKHNPRIKRSRDQLAPGDWVAGDVHHNDIIFQRDDGSLCTIKLVAWLDLATNRAFVTPFLMPKGQMIRREHVLESFAAMCADPNWGVPTRLYLDRGGEYNWAELAEDLCRLKHKIDIRDFKEADETEAATGVHRSRAYTPQSKVIEALFAALRSYFAQIPGYIGGNRMRKKVENQGKAPTPYPGDFDSFKNMLKTVLDYYHIKQQKGHLNGTSPNQSFQKFIDAGWVSTLLDGAELEIAFCKRVFRQVRAGGVFSLDNKDYRHDALMPFADMRKVQVGVPLFGDKSRLYLFDEEDNPIGIAEPVRVFAFDDVAGAGEQQRQSTVNRQQIHKMEAETDKLDLEKTMRNAADMFGPEPKAEANNIISISPTHQRLVEEAKDNPERSRHDKEDERLRMIDAAYEKLAQEPKAANGH